MSTIGVPRKIVVHVSHSKIRLPECLKTQTFMEDAPVYHERVSAHTSSQVYENEINWVRECYVLDEIMERRSEGRPKC